MSPEDHFHNLRLSAACAHLSREQISELLTITAYLFEERKRISRVLHDLPEHVVELRKLLSEIAELSDRRPLPTGLSYEYSVLPDVPDDIPRFVLEYAAGKALDRIAPGVLRVVRRLQERFGGLSVAPTERLWWSVYEAAEYTDDEIITEYLAGVLAASGEDDSGVPISELISRLSARDLRAHFVIYREVNRLGGGPVKKSSGRNAPHLFMPTAELQAALGVESGDGGLRRLEASMLNLARESLLNRAFEGTLDGPPADAYVITSPERPSGLLVGSRHPAVSGVIVAPSRMGMALLAWGCGQADPSPESFETMSLSEFAGHDIPTCPGAVWIDDLPVSLSPSESH